MLRGLLFIVPASSSYILNIRDGIDEIRKVLTFFGHVCRMMAPSKSPKIAAAQPASHRQAAERQGRVAETFVAQHWASRGYEVLARRFRSKAGEIDLIVANPETLVFIEVKSRKNMALAAHSVAPRQQYRLFQAADSALADHAEWRRPDIRFDIALVCQGAVEHIHDAIRAY